jgi:squalene-hopene/tetraprenyl-beta-curcumene cyclase
LALSAVFTSPSCNPADRPRIQQAADAGLVWLVGLQNRDGGWPTFCRGWGKLPFDRSGADLTAHALRALHAWQDRPIAVQSTRIVRRGFRYLAEQQRTDGSWVPLWFGNQDHALEENPIYGTSKVLLAYRDWNNLQDSAAQVALQWLARKQNEDGGWGGGPGQRWKDEAAGQSSVEETAVALEAMLATPDRGRYRSTVDRGLCWLVEAVESGRYQAASPIGFYFAKLWYYEQLYPVAFTLAALAAAIEQEREPP